MAAFCVSPMPACGQASSGPQIIDLRGDAGGKLFDGIGVVEGGGGTGVLLKDYPEPQRSQILDMVFKPKFGASVSALYVEIPGDGNSTQGSMPSHMHTRDDLNYSRGYIWWELEQARKRNPHLTLDGAAWSAPGWIGDNGEVFAQNAGKYSSDKNFYSKDVADYYIKWLKGLRDVYGLELDAIGARNEKGVSYDFVEYFRKALDENGFAKVKLHCCDNWPAAWKFNFVQDMISDTALRNSINIVSAHNSELVVSSDVQHAVEKMGKPMWDTEQHVYKPGFAGLIGTVKSFNEQFIRSGFTKIVDWYGIAGLYAMEPFSGEKEATVRANWPWSGHFETNEKLWGYAHYGQFTEAGWQYLNDGSGTLAGGGSFVTLKSPKEDYSIILETADAKAPQQVQWKVGAGLSSGDLAVWRSMEQAQFVRVAYIKPENGSFAMTLEPNAVYSLTTTRGQQKGHFDAVPTQKPFPFPYYETFEEYSHPDAWGYLPRYFADIAGAFELTPCPGNRGQCLRQMAPLRTISWAPDWLPYTIVGDSQWMDYEVSADVYLGAGESAAVMGRINDVGTGYGFIPKGYYLQLSNAGQLRLVVVRGKVDKKKLVGDAEQQALIKASHDDGAGGEKELGSKQLEGIASGQWHILKLRFEGSKITGFVDGKEALTASDDMYANGMAGLMAGADGKRLSMPYYDNIAITKVGSALPAPATALPEQNPMYGKVEKAR
jgi:galactosylceramidase